MRYLMYYLIIINIAAWLMYGLDKWKAKSGAWRIPERTLLLTALLGGSARVISRQVNIEGRVNGPVFIVILLLAVFSFYSIWRNRKALKLKTCLGINSEACTIKIICKKMKDESKIYFFCAVVEIIFQGGLYGITLWFCFYPTVILNTETIIFAACVIFLYFFSAGFLPDRLFADVEVMRGEKKDA